MMTTAWAAAVAAAAGAGQRLIAGRGMHQGLPLEAMAPEKAVRREVGCRVALRRKARRILAAVGRLLC